jgi:DnaK suppressor protein
MNRAQQLEQLKQDLLSRREALTQALAGDLTMLQEMRRGAGDVVDFAADSAAEVLSTQLAQSASRELSNIELALLKMKKNCYGQCEECSQNIAWPRLEALPYAAHCIQCQRMLEELEEEERSYGRPISFPNLGTGSPSFRDSDLV